MKSNLIVAICEATRLTRTQKLAEATRLIQNTLIGSTITTSAAAQRGSVAPNALPRLSDLRAEQLDIVGPRAAATNQTFSATPHSARIRRPLGETLDLLRQGTLQRLNHHLRMKSPTRRPSVREGAEFQTRSYAGPSGTRAYELYVPSHVDAATALLVMLHGCTQDPYDFANGTRLNEMAEEHGLIVAYPAQSAAANPSLCWNWFDLKHQNRGSGEPATIAGLTAELVREFGIGHGRVFIAGLSAGGAMAAIMGATYPDIYAAVGIHSGLGYGTAGDLVSALAAMRGKRRPLVPVGRSTTGTSIRTIVFHGDADQTVDCANGDAIVAAALADLDAQLEEAFQGRTPGGIDYVRKISRNGAGLPLVEHWVVHGLGHAWSGGSSDGSYTDPHGPDASREMIRFFLEQPLAHGRVVAANSS